MWNDIITAIGINGIVITAIAWLAKSIVSHFLTQDVENYKIQLKTQYDMKFAEFKFSLEKSAYEHQIRFSRLHDKRALVISELFAHLVDAVNATKSFVAIFEFIGTADKKDKYREAVDKIRVVYNYFDRNRIYLSEELCKKIEDILETIKGSTIEYSVAMSLVTYTDEMKKSQEDTLIRAWRSVENKVPLAKKGLEKEFRTLLGATN